MILFRLVMRCPRDPSLWWSHGLVQTSLLWRKPRCPLTRLSWRTLFRWVMPSKLLSLKKIKSFFSELISWDAVWERQRDLPGQIQDRSGQGWWCKVWSTHQWRIRNNNLIFQIWNRRQRRQLNLDIVKTHPAPTQHYYATNMNIDLRKVVSETNKWK